MLAYPISRLESIISVQRVLLRNHSLQPMRPPFHQPAPSSENHQLRDLRIPMPTSAAPIAPSTDGPPLPTIQGHDLVFKGNMASSARARLRWHR
ncbi:hypothetical protein FIBSPDRAFT_873048 [Athelia psychrophila]|uniref:Uncharacterized protein n=1 Tax=Athelia psychrophila TaxID=1759441 RepID=A0A165YXG3_9AGAM|nr:hypothetical protein FIBSPDRAFT_873048 [Fibularhizoctonia sp. CBS 109695]